MSGLLEIFDPNRPEAVEASKVPEFINDVIVRTLGGVTATGGGGAGFGGAGTGSRPGTTTMRLPPLPTETSALNGR